MLEKYRDHFSHLAPQETTLVAGAVAVRHRLPEVPDAESGAALWQFCEDAGLDQADVVLSLSRELSPAGVHAIETLVGRPIQRVAPPQPAKQRARGAAAARVDSRRIRAVAPNPKKPGSATYERFKLYQVGLSVDEVVAAGVTREDVRYDLAHGFVEVE